MIESSVCKKKFSIINVHAPPPPILGSRSKPNQPKAEVCVAGRDGHGTGRRKPVLSLQLTVNGVRF